MKGLGDRVRDLRKTKRLTLVEVAKSSGIDQATLSRIETGKMTGTLDSHRRIADALGVRLTDLYENMMDEISKSAGGRDEQRLEESISRSRGSIAQLLTAGVMQKKMLPVIIRLKAKGYTENETLPAGSERFIYVIKGGVALCIGKNKQLLRLGDSAYFSASMNHNLKNPLRQESVILSVITPTSA